MVQQNVILNMTPGPNRPTVNVSQYDTGARVLAFHLRQDGESFTPPDGCVAIIHGIKPDETYFSYTAEIDGDTVIADCTEQMTAVPGFAECEIKITNTEGRVGSCNFRLAVEKSPETGAIISDTDIPVFEQLTTRAEQAAASATASATAAEESAEQAGESATDAGESADRAAREAQTASRAAEDAGESATAAAQFAASASGSEASARQYSAAAEGFANEAENSAQGAAQDAQTASDKASEAAASADRASDSAVDSANATNLASGYADTARQQAQAAEGSATNAAGSASTATTAAGTATQKAGEASQSATAANTSAGQAASSASAASASAGTASEKATQAGESATNAANSASAAAGSASAASGSAAAALASEQAAAESARTLTLDPTLTQPGQAAEAKATGDAIAELKQTLNNLYDEHIYTVPKVFDDKSVYVSTTGGGDAYISNRTIPQGYTLDSFYCYSGTSGTGYIYVIEKDTSKVLYRQAINVVAGANNVAIGYTCPSDCYFGVRGSRAYLSNKGSDRATYGDYEFGTDGLYQPTTTTIKVGDTLTINRTTTACLIFAMNFTYSMPNTGIVAVLENEVDLAEKISAELTDNNLLRYALIDDNVGYLGRWFDYNGKKCTNNDGSELFFKTKNITFTTQVVTIAFGQITAQEVTPYYAYSVDGGDFIRKQITDNTITLAAESSITNEHIIRIVIDGMTESQGGNKYQGTLGVYIDSITVNVGNIIGIYPKCKIGMFLGDSITEGINSLGLGANASVNSAVNAYPYFCCKKLGAVSYRVGYGGTGMVVTGSFRSCEYALEYYYTGKHVGQFMVDFVVINHGINDYNNSVSTSDFKSAYENVINVLRAKFGAIPIFCLTPFNNAYETQIQEVADEYDNCYYISSDGWNGETVDGTHLSANGARNNGELLADAILPVLGKSYFIN